MTLGEMLMALSRPMLLSGFMFGMVTGVREILPLHGLPLLVMLIVVGATTYATLSLMLNRDGLMEAWRLLRPSGHE